MDSSRILYDYDRYGGVLPTPYGGNVVQDVWTPLITVTGNHSSPIRVMVKYETSGPFFEIGFGVYPPDSAGSATVSIDVYLRSE